METFGNLKELIRWLGRGQALLADMFSKRKTIAIQELLYLRHRLAAATLRTHQFILCQLDKLLYLLDVHHL